MSKIAFIFPGQGSQYIGMGKDFYESSETCKKIYDRASKASGLDVASLCFDENDRIHITEYTQIAILATEIAMLRTLEEAGIQPDVTAGLSLGEYGALVASKAISDEDVFALVRKRGIFMQEAYPTGGAMAAVLGLDTKIIEQICENTEGTVTIANYNCPGQIVISGEESAVSTAMEALKEAGAKRCIPLKVSGPFHSPLLKKASIQLGEELEKVTINQIQIPYIANVTADYVNNSDQVKQLLVEQVSSSVRWQQTVERMIEDGVTTFIEIGPGKTLTGFMKKINTQVQVFNIEKIEDVQVVVSALKA